MLSALYIGHLTDLLGEEIDDTYRGHNNYSVIDNAVTFTTSLDTNG